MHLDRIVFMLFLFSVVGICIYVSKNPFWVFGLFFLLLWPIISVDSYYIEDKEGNKEDKK